MIDRDAQDREEQIPRRPALVPRQVSAGPAQEALAHTLAYDATIMGDYSLPTERAASVRVPTLVIAGGASWDWMRNAAKTLAETKR